MDAPPDYVRVAGALACIPNGDADYETWLMLGMALHKYQGGLGAGSLGQLESPERQVRCAEASQILGELHQ